MLTRLFILLIFIFSFLAQADVSFREATRDLVNSGQTHSIKIKEAWIKYTCNGPITPKGKAVQIADIVSFYYPVKLTAKYPSIKEMYDQDRSRLVNIEKLCTEKRLAMTDRTGWNGNWLDWNTAYPDQVLKVSEVFITSNACRQVGSPCSKTSDCCQGGSAERIPAALLSNTCSKLTNACEKRIAIQTQNQNQVQIKK